MKKVSKQFELEEAIKAQMESMLPEARFSDRRYEHPDPVPMAPPVGYVKQRTMVEVVRDLVKSERLRQEAEEADADTFEEADDFDVGDDYEPASPYENEFEPPISALRQTQEAQQAQAPTPPSDGPNAPAAPATPPGGTPNPSEPPKGG